MVKVTLSPGFSVEGFQPLRSIIPGAPDSMLHSVCPPLPSATQNLQPHMRIGELNFFDHGFHRHVLTEIEHRKGMMGVRYGARQKQRCGRTRSGYMFHRSPLQAAF
jgi:hypothetical protein